MEPLRYYCLVVRTAFTHSLSVTQDVLFVAILCVGAAIWLAPTFHMTIDLTSWASALSGWAVAAITFGSIIGLRLLLASYWIWKGEREARIAAESTANNQETRKNIRVALGRFIHEADSLMARCRDMTISPPNDDSNAWAQRVETFLLSNLDESYIPRFRDGSNIIPLLPAGMSSRDHSNLYRDLQIRIARLNEFMSRYD